MKMILGWSPLITELQGMLAASDEEDTPVAHDFVMNQFERIGEHLDQLPEEHQLKLPTFAEYFAARAELLSGV